MKFSLVAVSMVASAFTGCATMPTEVAPQTIPAEDYAGYDCKDLARELVRLRKDEGELSVTMAQQVGRQAGNMIGGFFILPAVVGAPVIVSSAGGNSPEASRLARLRGEINAVEANRKERCNSLDVQLRQGDEAGGEDRVTIGARMDELRLLGPVYCLPSASPSKQLCELTVGRRTYKLASIDGYVKWMRVLEDGTQVRDEAAPGCTRAVFSGVICE